jgi:anaerobic ribonucleoside-triphosphate reductase activating protein
MNYCELKKTDIANGECIRVTLFVSGCTHRCKGCFNEIAWSFDSGKPFNESVQEEIFEALSPTWISGLTLLGGEPMEPENQRALLPFLREVKARFPSKNIWCYTGCVYERDLLSPSRWRTEVTDEILLLIDVLVDGPFVEDLKDISLVFRGSSNQRIIRLK